MSPSLSGSPRSHAVPLRVHSSPLSPSWSSHSSRSLSGSAPHSPSRSFPVPPPPSPRRTGRTANNSAPGMLAAAAPRTRDVTRVPALSPQRCHPRPRRRRLLSLVPRVALVLGLRVLGPHAQPPPASPRRAPLSTQDPSCRRCCCPRCGSARGDQSHPTAQSAPRPHSTPPSTPPTAML